MRVIYIYFVREWREGLWLQAVKLVEWFAREIWRGGGDYGFQHFFWPTDFDFNQLYAKIEKWIVKSDWMLKMVESKLACRHHQMLVMELET